MVRHAVGHAALRAPVPRVGADYAASGAPLTEHAYWYAELLGMLHCMPLRPVWGGFEWRALRRLREHAYRYAVLLGMLHCMPLRPL